MATTVYRGSSGLTSAQAEILLAKYGRNEIISKKGKSAFSILLAQFSSPLILVLIAAAAIASSIGFLPSQEFDIIDTVLILIIVLVSGILGFIQDYKAERTIEALKKLAAPTAHVVRDNKTVNISTADLVPGDIILLQAGDKVPADAQIQRALSLTVNEAPLTGESRAIRKKSSDKVFMNTYVLSGQAEAVVTATGMSTKMGKIADKLAKITIEKSPFEKDIQVFVKKLTLFLLTLMAVILVIGFVKYGFYEALLTTISLAVAAIPEGLPVIITLTLAVGVRKMSKENALVRKLSSIQSIGTIDTICTDKTGTITKNDMEVTVLFISGTEYNLKNLTKEALAKVKPLLTAGTLCNTVYISYKGQTPTYIGDSTEVALRKAADESGIYKKELDKKYKHIDEIPFTSARKLSTHIYKKGSSIIIYTKGASELLITRSTKVYENGKVKSLTAHRRRELLEKVKELSGRGLRVIAFGYKIVTSYQKSNAEHNLVFLGLEAMSDPPRDGVKEAIKVTKQAGIRTIMLTGDSPLTAGVIAKQVGINSKRIVLGREVETLSHQKLGKLLDNGINIFARVSPSHKLKILEILQEKHIVAMTGDGINDSLALKKADVGIAMGIKGTEVAKEAADIILLDDNYVSIAAAIKEGRRIFDNIRKFINYLFVSNFAEVFVIFLLTILMNSKTPVLIPVQLLWINLLTDGIPALALGIDPARPLIMKNPPRPKNEPIINKQLTWIIGAIGLKKGIVLTTTFFLTLPLGMQTARTVLFTGFIIYEFVRIGVIRHQEKLNWFSNKWLLVSIALSVGLQIGIIYSPFGRYFGTTPLGFYAWTVLIIGAGVGYILAIVISDIIVKYIPNVNTKTAY